MGGYFTDAVKLYNAAAGAYNASHGGQAAPTMTTSDMNLSEQLMLLTPSLEAGGDGYFFKLEVPLGFGDDGLPTAAQLVAKPLGEDTLLQVAAQMEAAIGRPQQVPQLF